MTLKELTQLSHLKHEIKADARRIEALNTEVESLQAEYKSKALDLAAHIKNKRARCIRERQRLEAYIANLPESLIRQIFTLRFVDTLSWEEIAESLGDRYSGKYLSTLCYRYLKKRL